MAAKTWFFTLALACFSAFSASAATVSFLVVETGLEGDERVESSRVWENALMDSFFEAGHIVCNAPIVRLPEKPGASFPEEAQGPFSEALAGGADYFIMALLEFAAPGPGGNPKPRSISLQIFTTRPRKCIFEKEYSGPQTQVPGEELTQAKRGGLDMASYLKDK